jgi:hypothetical protein
MVGSETVACLTRATGQNRSLAARTRNTGYRRITASSWLNSAFATTKR